MIEYLFGHASMTSETTASQTKRFSHFIKRKNREKTRESDFNGSEAQL